MNACNTMFEGDGPELVYHNALENNIFQIQRCNSCEKHIFFPRVICNHCGSGDLIWVEPCGLGTVYSTTVLRRKPSSGGNLNIALIDLKEGPRMMSRVEGVAAEDVRIGMIVEAQIIREGDQPLVVFQPTEGALP